MLVVHSPEIDALVVHSPEIDALVLHSPETCVGGALI